nr:hypothetical protein [Tanacetum cinerariifolium]
MDMRRYEVPCVLDTCRINGLRFGVENKEEFDTQANLPFRRRVFSSHLDGQHITGIDVANAIVGPTFSELYDDDAVGLCCLGILQLVILGAESRRNVPEWNANVRRWGPLYGDQPRNEDDPTTYSIFGYTWAFKTWILESFRVTAIRYFDRFNRYPRVTAWSKKKGRFLAEMVIPFFEGNIPDDNEARSDWWISSRAYFDCFIDQVERIPFDLSRQNMYEIPSDIYRQFVEQKIELERNRKDVDEIKKQMLKFKEEMNARSFFNMGTPSNFQTPMRSQLGSSDWQRQMPEQSASQYWQPLPQPGSFGQNILNRGKRQQLPSKYLVTPFTAQPPTTMVPKQHVSKNKNKGKKANLSPVNLGGFLEGYNEENNNATFLGSQFTGNILFYENVDPAKHMNSWMELMIRRRPLNANWTVAYTITINIHAENNQFIILRDPHVIKTLDGSTRPYPSWNDVDWVLISLVIRYKSFNTTYA